MIPALDPTAADPSVRVQDDLFRHVNGTWLTTTEIDPDKASAGTFVTLREQAREAVREIIEDLARECATSEHGLDERAKVAALYAAFMDEQRIEELGTEPARPLLERVDTISSTTDLARHWGWCLRHGISTLLDAGADADMDDPTSHALHVYQSGLGLPDRDYYLTDDYAAIREQYLAHVTRMLELLGTDDAAAQAQAVLELETEVARCHWDRVRSRDLQAKHNPMTWGEFSASAPGLHLDEVLDGARIAPGALTRLNISQPSFFTDVAGLVTAERLDAWRAWARFHLVSSLAPYLSSAVVEENFDFYSRTLAGTQEQTPRWKRGAGLVEGVMGEAIAKVYVERHFPASSKARMDELVANLLAAYAQSISTLPWMGEQTRQEALHKLQGFRPKIGYPARWRDYSDLEVTPGELVTSVLQASSFALDWELGKLSRPVDPDEWLMLPQTVNAYYHPLRNEIVFPAAILQPPFFNPDADDAVNYGGIGSVIGHEIGHGFDDQGATCDGDGRLRNWWTEQDLAAFQERTGALVEQYDALVPTQLRGGEPEPHVNGQLTIGENIGDLGGLGIALKAWRLATGGQEPEPIDGLSGTQRLFFGYARIWCAKNRDELARRLLVVDPHSPGEFRCNQIARNVDAFHEAFGTQPGDGMWLDPQQRVSIW